MGDLPIESGVVRLVAMTPANMFDSSRLPMLAPHARSVKQFSPTRGYQESKGYVATTGAKSP